MFTKLDQSPENRPLQTSKIFGLPHLGIKRALNSCFLLMIVPNNYMVQIRIVCLSVYDIEKIARTFNGLECTGSV